jgi:hypothetical protein
VADDVPVYYDKSEELRLRSIFRQAGREQQMLATKGSQLGTVAEYGAERLQSRLSELQAPNAFSISSNVA